MATQPLNANLNIVPREIRHRRRALGSQQTLHRVDPLPVQGAWNSFCLTCARWHFGHRDAVCHHCHAAIRQWVHDDDLRHFASRSSLGCV